MDGETHCVKKCLFLFLSFFLNSSLLYARPEKICSDFRIKLDLNMSYEFKIARSLILSGVVPNQALIRGYDSKQRLYQSVCIYSFIFPLQKVILLRSEFCLRRSVRVVQSNVIYNHASTAHKPALWKREWNNSGTNCTKTRVSRSGWGRLASGQRSGWVQRHKCLVFIWRNILAYI